MTNTSFGGVILSETTRWQSYIIKAKHSCCRAGERSQWDSTVTCDDLFWMWCDSLAEPSTSIQKYIVMTWASQTTMTAWGLITEHGVFMKQISRWVSVTELTEHWGTGVTLFLTFQRSQRAQRKKSLSFYHAVIWPAVSRWYRPPYILNKEQTEIWFPETFRHHEPNVSRVFVYHLFVAWLGKVWACVSGGQIKGCECWQWVFSRWTRVSMQKCKHAAWDTDLSPGDAVLPYITVISWHVGLEPDVVSVLSRVLQGQTERLTEGQIWYRDVSKISCFFILVVHAASVLLFPDRKHTLTVQSRVLRMFASGSVLFRDDVLGWQGSWWRPDFAIAFLEI